MVTIAYQNKNKAIWAHYLLLTKPKAIIPHLITAAAAMFLAVKGIPQLNILLWTLTGGGLTAGAAHALNCYFDREIDKNMDRTRFRPLPAGRLLPRQALVFSIFTGITGLVVLSVLVNRTAAFLALIALLYYVCAYTLMLKRHTYWSALIGSGIGGITPLIGWTAVTNSFSLTPFILSAIIILWTLPHFWSLAIVRQTDYEHAGIKVLPPKGVRIWIFGSSILLTGTTLMLAQRADGGPIYLAMAAILGSGIILLSIILLIRKQPRTARIMYVYSIIYIACLFAAIIADRVVFR
jgi:protoheme IX farnesyltransferase